jgi:hypothetical protein
VTARASASALAHVEFAVLPISFNAWPSANGNNAAMNIEFELQNQSFEAHSVVVSIPCISRQLCLLRPA